MDFELSRLNKLVKRFDRSLFAKRTDGVLQVFQPRRVWEPLEFEGQTILFARDREELVMSVTDNWSAKGVPVSWGYVPLYQRLSEVIRPADEVVREMNIQNEKVREMKQNYTRRVCEDAAYEARDMFKKTFNDVNTSAMDKSKDPRRKGDFKWQS